MSVIWMIATCSMSPGLARRGIPHLLRMHSKGSQACEGRLRLTTLGHLSFWDPLKALHGSVLRFEGQRVGPRTMKPPSVGPTCAARGRPIYTYVAY